MEPPARLRARWAPAIAGLGEQVPACSLAAFRIAYGAVMLFALVRFAGNGWIDDLYVAPRFHFHYFGLAWVRPLPAPWIYAHFAVLGLAALAVMLGAFYRVSIVVFTVLFTWMELLDAATYLNHYYAISLLGILLSFMPAERRFSIDAWRARRRGAPLPTTVPFWTLAMLRGQLGVVYFFAGVAKLNADWLLHAEPLHTWLVARSDLPLVGRILEHPLIPMVMSWSGALFDLSIAFLLLAPRTRWMGYLSVVAFHLLTGWLFPTIGIFPYVMVVLTPVFFGPSWPIELMNRLRGRRIEPEPVRVPPSRGHLALMAGWMAFQCVVPLRHLAYPGDVLWTQEGARWSWRVMLAERAAVSEIRVLHEDGRAQLIDPDAYLSPLQVRMMAAEPDLLIQFAHFLRDEHAARGEPIEVHAEVWAAINGHPSARLVDPAIDLAREEESVCGHAWLHR
jgi:hypothetical protein